MSLNLSNAVVGHWCGGVHLTPADLAGPGVLAATPVYLDEYDTMLLFVAAAGGAEAAVQSLNEYNPAQLDDAVFGNRRRSTHDEIVAAWDRRG